MVGFQTARPNKNRPEMTAALFAGNPKPVVLQRYAVEKG